MVYAHLAPRSLYDFPPIRLSLFAYLAGMSRCARANHHVYMCFELRHLRLELTGQIDGQALVRNDVTRPSGLDL
jgi:hypothetical protein